MDLYDALMTTRAMRRFRTDPVDEAAIGACLRAAVQAPSGGNVQPYHFVVVTDAKLRAALAELYLKSWERYAPAVAKVMPPFPDEATARRYARNIDASDHLARTIALVPVHVLVLVPRMSMFIADEQGEMDIGPLYASVYPAVQNLILAARSFGLGTVLTTIPRIHEAEIRALLEIPDRFELAAFLPLGHPTGTWGVAPRRPAVSLTSWNRFGERR